MAAQSVQDADTSKVSTFTTTQSFHIMISKVETPILGVLDPYHEVALQSLRQAAQEGQIHLLERGKVESALIKESADALIIRSDSQLTSLELRQYKRLKYIVKQGVGLDNIDLKGAKDLDIQVYNTPGLNGEAVAELSLSLALHLARRLGEFDRKIRNGENVQRSKMLGRSLHGKVLGVIGMGNIGFLLAKKWIGAMEGKIIAYDPYYTGNTWWTLPSQTWEQVSELEDLLRRADVVSLHVPLTQTTRNLISTREFELMKDEALLLNCARGSIVDEEALVQALRLHQIAGAGLDAMSVEPPTRENYALLLEQENVILTPHVGASTKENQADSGLAVVQIVLKLMQGGSCDSRVV